MFGDFDAILGDIERAVLLKINTIGEEAFLDTVAGVLGTYAR